MNPPSDYQYSPLVPNSDTIRIIRLLPSENANAPVHCVLVNYTLSRVANHNIYEALSYVWGNPARRKVIIVNKKYQLSITENLHTALLRLRNHAFERILWIDAICINQNDNEEKSQQVQLMAQIYEQASRVIVWLGEAAEGSDDALEHIRLVADGERPGSHNLSNLSGLNSSTNKQKLEYFSPTPTVTNHAACLNLLKRPWFERIWILQEVAAARCIIIMCGSTVINGYTFCSGIHRSDLSYENEPDLQSRIRSITYLIRGAIFRPKDPLFTSKEHSLGELIDMYHNRQATILHDKIYALLGMSSDGKLSGLRPNYTMPADELLQRLIPFLLSDQVSVEAQAIHQTVKIRTTGYLMGRITKVAAKSLQVDDLIVLVDGGARPMIIRPSLDRYLIIMIHAGRPESIVQHDSTSPAKACIRDFRLLWHWESSSAAYHPESLDDTFDARTNILIPDTSHAALDETYALHHMVPLLEDCESFVHAATILGELSREYARDFGTMDGKAQACLEKLAYIYEKNMQPKEARQVFKQLILTSKDIKGPYNFDTLSILAEFITSYRIDGSWHGSSREVVKKRIAEILERLHQNGSVDSQEKLEFELNIQLDIEALLFLADSGYSCDHLP